MEEKDLERAAYWRVLLVIAGGTHEDPTRLAREVLESRIGVTEEILDSPMWKHGTDEAYYADGLWPEVQE